MAWRELPGVDQPKTTKRVLLRSVAGKSSVAVAH